MLNQIDQNMWIGEGKNSEPSEPYSIPRVQNLAVLPTLQGSKTQNAIYLINNDDCEHNILPVLDVHDALQEWEESQNAQNVVRSEKEHAMMLLMFFTALVTPAPLSSKSMVAS